MGKVGNVVTDMLETAAKSRDAVTLASADFQRRRALAAASPSMPAGWWGAVTFKFQDGRCILVEVTEQIKP